MYRAKVERLFPGPVQNGWKAISTGGTVFDDVDLREDWAEFCEKVAASVGVYSIEGRFRRI